MFKKRHKCLLWQFWYNLICEISCFLCDFTGMSLSDLIAQTEKNRLTKSNRFTHESALSNRFTWELSTSWGKIMDSVDATPRFLNSFSYQIFSEFTKIDVKISHGILNFCHLFYTKIATWMFAVVFKLFYTFSVTTN